MPPECLTYGGAAVVIPPPLHADEEKGGKEEKGVHGRTALTLKATFVINAPTRDRTIASGRRACFRKTMQSDARSGNLRIIPTAWFVVKPSSDTSDWLYVYLDRKSAAASF